MGRDPQSSKVESSTKPTPLIILTAKNKSLKLPWLLLRSVVLAHLSMLVLSQPPAPSPAPSEGGVVIPASPGIRRIARHHSDKSEDAGEM
ncbi:hypothetical protein OIU84_013986 [Salix udensis]|uniref:Uncharacterized protein n=1 Tax=Salix udensis TaxID=889485 RepID=A0AAD6JBH6_9ROSI|nr:hypothetical protein OIU84_013986 [Salix udensis]